MNIDELRDEISDHRGRDGAEREFSHFEEDREPARFVSGDGASAIGRFETRQSPADPEHGDDPEVEEESDPDDPVGALPAIEFRDEVGAEKCDRVGEDADSDREDDFGAADLMSCVVELDEAGDAEDVEHGERAEEEPGEHKEDGFATRMERGFGELGKTGVGVLRGWDGLGVHELRICPT